MKPTELQRFMSFVEMTETCWEWRGCRIWSGYGHFTYKGKQFKAHRASYDLFVGPIPEGLTIDHLCRNRGCVNPAHLEAVTGRENSLRGIGITAINAKKTECHFGHPFTKDNTYFTGRHRACATCAKKRAAEQRKRKKTQRVVV